MSARPYFRPDDAMPSMTLRCSRMNAISTGAVAIRLAAMSASGLRACKESVNEAIGSAVGEVAIVNSLELTRAAFAHPDAVEGASAFLGKRTPSFPSTRPATADRA